MKYISYEAHPLKFDIVFSTTPTNSEKLFASKLIGFEFVAVSSPYYTENTCHWLLMFQQTVSRIQVLTRDSFSNSIPFRVMGKHDRSAAMHISGVFETL